MSILVTQIIDRISDISHAGGIVTGVWKYLTTSFQEEDKRHLNPYKAISRITELAQCGHSKWTRLTDS